MCYDRNIKAGWADRPFEAYADRVSSVSLEVKGPITMEIEADFDSDKQKCSFEVKLEWRLGEAQPRERGERSER